MPSFWASAVVNVGSTGLAGHGHGTARRSTTAAGISAASSAASGVTELIDGVMCGLPSTRAILASVGLTVGESPSSGMNVACDLGLVGGWR